MKVENFSVAKRNNAVIEIFQELEKKNISKSDYICKAIIEKYEREKNLDTDVKNLVRTALIELIEEGIFSTGTMINTLSGKEEKKRLEKSTQPKLKEEKISHSKGNEENGDLLRQMLLNID